MLIHACTIASNPKRILASTVCSEKSVCGRDSRSLFVSSSDGNRRDWNSSTTANRISNWPEKVWAAAKSARAGIVPFLTLSDLFVRTRGVVDLALTVS